MQGESCEWSIITHAPYRLFLLCKHRAQHKFYIFVRVTKELLAKEQFGRIERSFDKGADDCVISARRTRYRSNHRWYGCRCASTVLISLLRNRTPCSRSTAIISPGPSRPFSTTSCASKGTTPASPARMSRPCEVRV